MTSSGRGTARRLCVFNHKGGVGKTTLTINVAAALGRSGKRVLLVDADPQCSLTSYLLQSDVVDDLLDKSDQPGGSTLWSAVKPVADGTGGVLALDPLELAIPGLFLLPGDIRLAEFESELSTLWNDSLQRRPRGLRGTTAISTLVSRICLRTAFDLVFFDVGPNIGALNRAVLLDADAFVVPVACDLFSIRALKTLGRTLVSWIKDWSTIAALAPADLPLLPGRPEFLGYVPERFRVYGGLPTKSHSWYLAEIDKYVQSDVVDVLRAADPKLVRGNLADLRLAEIKEFGSSVAEAQRTGQPLGSLDDAASSAFAALAKRILQRLAMMKQQ